MNILPNLQQIAELIIRPNRYLYKPIDLGPKLLPTTSAPIHHHDFQLRNSRNLTLKASLYTQHEHLHQVRDVLIYLHCNSGCRIEGLAYMKLAIANQLSYVVFDFGGSGLSEGRYVSLGLNQADDIRAVVRHLVKKIGEGVRVVLWGRSMGAVAALKYLSDNSEQGYVLSAVLDSPFQSLKELFMEIGKQKTNLPRLVLEVALNYLKPIVQKKAGFNIDQVNLKGIGKIKNCPAIFIASKKDALVPFEQMDNIFKQYPCTKQMHFVQESHNQPRNVNVIKEVFATLRKFIVSNKGVTKPETHGPLPKDQSKQKLQLTIKSYSQKNLVLPCKSNETPREGLKQISFPHLEKRYISCLFDKKKKSKSTLSQDFMAEDTENVTESSQLKKKKQPVVRKFFKDQAEEQAHKPNLIRFKSQKQCGDPKTSMKSRDQQRKTMQHIANKKPPYIDNQKIHEFRNSLESKYRSELTR